MTSIDALARQLMTNYDANRDGSVALSNETERVDRHADGGSWHYATVTARRAFRAADQLGNRDGRVTEAELVALGRSYDTGEAFWLPNTKGDGRLEGIEALRAFGEVGEETLGVVGATRREDGGGTFLSADQSGGALVSAGPQGGIVLGGNRSSGNWFGAIGDAMRGAWASMFDGHAANGSWP
ncbi:MAG: hypothetical protein KDC46_09960 [Thermoleophilia bacterium]|nr:hypothetical protein [Thermoleophilia bacterium]